MRGDGKKLMNQYSKICTVCKNEYKKPSTSSWKLWEARQFCSKKCQGIGHGKRQTGTGNAMYGKKITDKHKQIIREANTGAKSHLWKGDDVDYRSLHEWVRRWKGTPDTCEYCGISGLKGHHIQWANVDGKYRRVLEDYIRLCAKCHWHYDRGNN